MIPNDLKYTREHEWVRIEGNVATIGITHFAQDKLGDIVYVDISKNSFLKKDSIFGTIEAVKIVSDLFMPLSGKIIEINAFLEQSPELVNSDPYEDGWMIMVEIEDTNEISDLLTSEQYDKLVN